jgi:aryl-alcohol dehydrogenase-like predicted oxidoreductase
MRYLLFGPTGLRVSELCLGTMTFGEEWGWGSPPDQCRAIFDAYLDAGGNFIDTANYYTAGTSETILGDLIASQRDRLVLATKYTLAMKPGDLNSGGNHRKNLMQSVEGSLRRLRTEYIDLLWLHAWDYTTPIEEVMRALDDLVRMGKVFYVGVSDTPAWIVSRANLLAELRGWSAFAGLQVEYSLVERTPERELLPMARALGLAITPWSPLGGGLLTGKYRHLSSEEQRRLKADNRRMTERNFAIVEEVCRVAEEIGCTPGQVALRWVQLQAGRPIPILGARTLEQLRENLESLQVNLSGEHLDRLDRASAISLGFPHEFLASDGVNEILFGGLRDRLEGFRKP